MGICCPKQKKAFHRLPVSLMAFWLAGFAALILSSCAARVKQEQRMFEQQMLLSDTACYALIRSTRNLLDRQSKLQWQQVTLSPPDSAGHQYPEQIVRGSLREKMRHEQMDTVQSAVQRITKVSEEIHSKQQTSAETHSYRNLTYGLFTISILLLLLFRKKKK